jgi:hypothetical protein
MIEDQWDGDERRKDQKWHVGKEIPLTMLLAILIQTGGGIWWAASLSAKIDAAIQTITEFKAERYTKDDARRDRELFLQLVEQQRQADREHERRIGDIEMRARK